MTLDRRKLLEINLNTIVVVVQFVGMIAMGGYVYANQTRDIEQLRDWQINHDKSTDARVAENREIRGKTDERIKGVEKAVFEGGRVQDQIAYRVTVLETSLAAQQVQSQKIADGLSELGGDMKVVKKILEDMQASNKRRSP